MFSLVPPPPPLPVVAIGTRGGGGGHSAIVRILISLDLLSPVGELPKQVAIRQSIVHIRYFLSHRKFPQEKFAQAAAKFTLANVQACIEDSVLRYTEL